MGLIRRATTLRIGYIKETYQHQMEKQGYIMVHGKSVQVIFQYDYNTLQSMIQRVSSYFKAPINSDMHQFGLLNGKCAFKVIAKGFIFHKTSYLRDGWNILDFVVVISAILEILPSVESKGLKGLRALRSFRPLRSINAIPSMKKLVKILLISLPNLANVVALMAFIILMFAILGLHQFNGMLYYRCRLTEKPINSTYWPILPNYERLCSINNGKDSCPAGTYCGSPDQYNIDISYDNVSTTEFLNYDIVNFDNIGTSLLTVFQVLTIEGWSNIMYNYMDSTNVYFSAIYFETLVIFGAYFLLNLILAVIIEAYNKIDLKEKKREIEKLEEEGKKREKKFNAIKQMFRMMRLTQKKKQLIESAGYQYRYSFFDVVFELVRVERYEKVMKGGLQVSKKNQQVEAIKQNFENKLQEQLTLQQSQRDEKNDEYEGMIQKDLHQEDKILEEFKDSNNYDKALSQHQQDDLKSIINDKTIIADESQFKEDENDKLILESQSKQSSQRNSIQTKNEDQLKIKIAEQDQYSLNKQSTTNMDKTLQQLYQTLNLSNVNQSKDESKVIEIQNVDLEEGVEIKAKFNYCENFRDTCFLISEHTWFSFFMTFFIVANTVIMSLDQYPINDFLDRFLDISNYFFFAIFSIEMIIKQIGLGFKKYLQDRFNIFDAIIILLGLIEIVISSSSNGRSSSTLSVFRGFRILRLLKLVKSWKKLQELLSTISNTLKDLRNFSILLLICVITYTLLGLEFYAYKLKFDDNGIYNLQTGKSPRINFDNFLNAFLTIFINLQSDSWNIILYDTTRVMGWYSIIFFVTLIIFGQIILLKLFLAVLLENFEDKRKEIKKRNTEFKHKSLFEKLIDFIKFKICKCKETSELVQENNNSMRTMTNIGLTKNFNLSIITKDKSLYIFKYQSKFRQLCIALARSNKFEYFILCLILISSVFLAIENPLDDTVTKKSIALSYMDIIITSIFTLEVFIKLIARGLLINGEMSYLRSAWNVLDFIIVIFSIISISANNEQLKIFKVLRLIRVLRPLRVISRNEGLKLAVQTLIAAIPNIFNVIIISGVFYLIFGIFFVTFLKGRLDYCDMDNIDNQFQSQIVTKWDCFNLGGIWTKPQANFDNVLNSLKLMYTIVTVNWVDHMFQAVDTNDIDMQPIRNNKTQWILFFIVFMIIFTFFLLNLFVGVVVSTFNQEKQRLGKNFLLTDTQKEWINMKMLLLNTKPAIKKFVKSQSKIRRFCFSLVTHSYFELFIFICIICNTLVLTLKWYLMPLSAQFVVQILNYIFAGIFTLEAIFKTIALGKTYFSDNWNKFDFLIVLATLLGIILDITTTASLGAQATIIRAFRVVRIFRIVQRAKVLRIIIDTLIVTLPSLANVGGLLLLILYIYSILGMKLFARIKLKTHLNQQANFQTFGNAFVTLIRVSTGEDWDLMMLDMLEPYSITNQCDLNFDNVIMTPELVPNGCEVTFALPYFFTFNLIVAIVFLNLFVAIILQSFDEMQRKENQLLNDKNMDQLRICWAEFDPEGTFFIDVADLISFLCMLGEPLGFNQVEQVDEKKQSNFLKHIELPTYNKFKHYYYYDVIQALARYAYVKIETERKMKDQLMSDSSNFEKLTVEIINNIMKELEFQDEVFRVKEVQAFKQAIEKEKKLYQKMLAIKDELDSQHLWAGSRIKNMYGKTKMNFLGGFKKGGVNLGMIKEEQKSDSFYEDDSLSQKSKIETEKVLSTLQQNEQAQQKQQQKQQSPQQYTQTFQRIPLLNQQMKFPSESSALRAKLQSNESRISHVKQNTISPKSNLFYQKISKDDIQDFDIVESEINNQQIEESKMEKLKQESLESTVENWIQQQNIGSDNSKQLSHSTQSQQQQNQEEIQNPFLSKFIKNKPGKKQPKQSSINKGKGTLRQENMMVIVPTQNNQNLISQFTFAANSNRNQSPTRIIQTTNSQLEEDKEVEKDQVQNLFGDYQQNQAQTFEPALTQMNKNRSQLLKQYSTFDLQHIESQKFEISDNSDLFGFKKRRFSIGSNQQNIGKRDDMSSLQISKDDSKNSL